MHKKSPLRSLKKKQDFKRVYGNKKSAANPLFVVYAAENEIGENRLGLSVSKKVGNAVVRNRIRRWVKEACRLTFVQAPTRGYDFVVIARSSAGTLPREGSFAVVSGSLSQLFSRLGVLSND
ncbi:MAG: ribonuclease P protein component [Defluviitaleaceae bacterium]|nr:ribonuclease P protein component [Defluviitaleaceae bacterium]